MADKQTTPELIEYMVRQAANGEIPFNLLAFTIGKLQEAEMQKNNVVNQQPQAIVQPSVKQEPPASIFARPEPRPQPQQPVQTPFDTVVDDQQAQREREIFGRPSQGAASQPQQSIPTNPNNPIIKHAVPPYDPSRFNGSGTQPVQPASSQPVQPAASQPAQPAASQPAQPAASQPAQPVVSQTPPPVAPITTGPQANAQALNNIDPNDIRLQQFMDMEPKRFQVLKKNMIEEEKRLKLKIDSAPKSRAKLYTTITALAVIGCLIGTYAYGGGGEAATMYGLSIVVTTASVLFFNSLKKKVFDKPKHEKLHFLKGLQDFMNAEDVRKKLEFTIESNKLIAAEEARRASR